MLGAGSFFARWLSSLVSSISNPESRPHTEDGAPDGVLTVAGMSSSPRVSDPSSLKSEICTRRCLGSLPAVTLNLWDAAGWNHDNDFIDTRQWWPEDGTDSNRHPSCPSPVSRRHLWPSLGQKHHCQGPLHKWPWIWGMERRLSRGSQVQWVSEPPFLCVLGPGLTPVFLSPVPLLKIALLLLYRSKTPFTPCSLTTGVKKSPRHQRRMILKSILGKVSLRKEADKKDSP